MNRIILLAAFAATTALTSCEKVRENNFVQKALGLPLTTKQNLARVGITENVAQQLDEAGATVAVDSILYGTVLVTDSKKIAVISGITNDSSRFTIEFTDLDSNNVFSENEKTHMEREFKNEYFNILSWDNGLPYDDIFGKPAGLTTAHILPNSIRHDPKAYLAAGLDSVQALPGHSHMSIKNFLKY